MTVRLGSKVETTDVPWAALVPILVILLAFVVFCWVDISRHAVKHLPKWAWAIIVAISIPLGGIVYLIVGRDSNRQ
ncbi:PLDc N-terminal domain-containing protein [Demequina aurantiaca]|uniref:PLDc N-terminal domain-containing protein n=1 Tax=Demequina aurantiaca TaxID=676200 RepID=UPI00191C0E6F|nr:PLD nuclease N-terminal domain-containing protein [Demequina aurantiaca]